MAIYPLSDVPEALDHLSPPRGPGAVPSAPPAPALVDGEAPPGRHPLPAVPRYNFIVPDLCHDMHENISCSQSNRVLFGDTWLSTEVPTILASQAYLNNGALFITWDEGASGDGPIGMIVLSPKAKGGGYANTIAYDHSSMLRTVEEIFGVTPLLGGAANATDLSDLFVSFP